MDRIMIRTSRFRGLVSLLIALVLAAPCLSLESEAYFNRGSVSLSLGQKSVSLAAGSSASVSAAVDPIKQDQLPGCGMAECPQTCGDGCLNESGECMCAGTEYKTYYADVSAASSDASVASASWENGTLTITGHSPGSAVITVTGKLRQYTDASETVQVTVTQDTAGDNSSGSSGSSSKNSTRSDSPAPSSSGHTVTQNNSEYHEFNSDNTTSNDPVIVEDAGSGETESGNSVPEISESQASQPVHQTPESAAEPAVPPSADTVPEQQETESAASPEGELRDTARGKYRFVVLTASTDIPSCFLDAASEGSHLVFQKKTGDNIDYSWTFDGEKLDPEEDYTNMNLEINCSSQAPDQLKDSLKGKDSFYMDFDYSGKLPETAEIYMKVNDSFSEDQKLYLYRVKALDGSLTEINPAVEMSNGYASFTLDHCSSYVLVNSRIKGADPDSDMTETASSVSDLGLPLILLLILASGAAAAVLIILFKRQKHR